MPYIDIASILFLFVLTCTAIAVFFTIDTIFFRKNDRSRLVYISSKFIQALAVAVLLIPGYADSMALIICHNVFFFTGFAGELYIIIAIYSTRNKLHLIALLAMVSTACIYNTINILTNGMMPYRILITGVFTFFLYLYFGLALLLNKKKSRMQRVTGWISCIFAIPWALRTYYAIMNISTIEVLHSNLFQTIAYLGNIVFFTVLPMLYLFIYKEQDQQKLQKQVIKISTQNEELKALNATKDEFFRIIGHDLKNPIGQMIQLFQVIEDKQKELNSEKLLDLIKTLKESSERGFNLLENLLKWAQSQSGNISYNPEPVSLAEMIDENIKLLEKHAEIKRIQIRTSNKYEGTVTIDQNMINTVIRNLLSNAIKFTRNQGEIIITNRTDNNHLIVSVKDNGVGMSSEDSAKLFKVGSGHTTPGTNNEKGTGIGLILCKEFIDKHQGEIWVESELDKGSEFFFSIPVNS